MSENVPSEFSRWSTERELVWVERLGEWVRRAERAEAAIERVRALHVHTTEKSPSGAHTYVACAECGYADGGRCPTIAALDSTQPDTPAPGRSGEERLPYESAGHHARRIRRSRPHVDLGPPIQGPDEPAYFCVRESDVPVDGEERK